MDDLHRRFVRLTVLNILANLTIPLVGLVDTGMLGHLPDLRFLAGVALASVVFDFLFWSLNFLRMATTGTTAQSRGREDRGSEYRGLYRALILGVLLATTVVTLQEPIRRAAFALLAVPQELLGPASDYFGTRIWSAPAVLVNFAFLGWFLGREQSGCALVMTLVANLGNVGLNYLFIVHLGWAAYGAGLATTLSQILMTLVAVVLFLRQGSPVSWQWARLLDREQLTALMRLNRDILLRTLCLTLTFALFTALSGRLGEDELVTNTILQRLLVFAAYFIDGAAFAVESLAGIFFGAGDRPRLRRLVRLGLVTAQGLGASFLLLLLLFPNPIFHLLTSHESILLLCRHYGWWLFPVLLLGAPAFLFDGLFLGLTSGRLLRNAMIVATLVGFVPLATLALARGDNHLLWAALTLWMASRSATLGWAAWRQGLVS